MFERADDVLWLHHHVAARQQAAPQDWTGRRGREEGNEYVEQPQIEL